MSVRAHALSRREVSMKRISAVECGTSFLLGGLVGAAAALFYAPCSGRELRGLMGEKVRDGADRSRELADRAIERGREWLIDAGQGLQSQGERLAAAIQAGRETYREE